MRQQTIDRPALAWTALLVLATARLALLLLASLVPGYEHFRDELYYLACSEHLDLGYVDHPPLSVWILWLVRSLLGDSLLALRLVPALAGAAVVLLVGLVARELGGGRRAQVLAALASFVSLIQMGFCAYYSMNSLDLLVWSLAAYLLTRIIHRGRPGLWIALGVLLGLGLLNKISVLWLGAAIAVGLVCSPERRWLRTRWPWLAGALSLGLFSPFVYWNWVHDWAHLEFMRNAMEFKYSGLTRMGFLTGHFLLQNPVTCGIWLGSLTLGRLSRRFRMLGLMFLVPFGILLANGHSKSEYLAAAFAPLFAAGGCVFERFSERRGFGGVARLAGALLLCGLILVPLPVTLLPAPQYIRYAAALGLGPSSNEGKALAALPQYFADRFGWRDKAEAVADVFHELTPEEQARCALFASNYGRAGALDFHGPARGLPSAISSHNSYWIWGPGDASREIFLYLGGDRARLEELFESVEVRGQVVSEYAMPYENNLSIYLCRGLRIPVAELWTMVKHYE